MVKYTSPLIVAALVAAPALAQSSWDDFDAREYDDLYTRHPDEVGLTARAPSYADAPRSIFARADDFDETFSRRSYGNAGNLAAREIDVLYERALEQLEARDVLSPFFFIRYGMAQVKKIAHQPPSPVQGTKSPHASTDAAATKSPHPSTDAAATTGAAATTDATATTDAAATKTPKKPYAEGTEPPADKPPSGEEVKPEGDGSVDGSADNAPTAPEAREFDDDEYMWERDYYGDEDVYGRAYDDEYELDARSGTYDYFDDLD